ncbi:hypothetical protein SAMN03159474_05672 [Pseudomonas sp. NFACC08-1]|nr:hypothetical protein SAMN03159424_04650 [Pseudomonas sp. NFACC05-1]SDB52440.1 hypothetical protein SAMN03159386_03998 [Pseudomonas sp. NFACC17-2]SDY52622.1 hypothetical protein SAMN03159474_05672 [Pseudomonas sp. NFACC08-1]SEJ72212.1 hypothetical protein SAMN03159382_03979 [Pseudomonas sp. NFACC23-1]SFM07070.1 hypothetical protein SAMN03159307_05692 [Pseudomonas sp. NFACC46-3]SFW84654.1 hypothetical protein SAMN05660640_04279 [Pseudomonas sp. NFACC16-2]
MGYVHGLRSAGSATSRNTLPGIFPSEEGHEALRLALHDEPNDFLGPVGNIRASQALKGMYKPTEIEI